MVVLIVLKRCPHIVVDSLSGCACGICFHSSIPTVCSPLLVDKGDRVRIVATEVHKSTSKDKRLTFCAAEGLCARCQVPHFSPDDMLARRGTVRAVLPALPEASDDAWKTGRSEERGDLVTVQTPTARPILLRFCVPRGHHPRPGKY